MAITATERSEIVELVVLMLDAAPGAAYLQAIVAAYEASGRNLHVLADLLGNTALFQSVNTNFQSAEEFAQTLLAPLGLQDDPLVHDFVVAQVNGGAAKADVIFVLWQVLHNLPPGLPQQYVDAQAALQNRAYVAEYYSITLGESATDLAALQDVIVHVGADPASVDAALAAINAHTAAGPQLTTAADTIRILGTAQSNVTGVVDADADGNVSHSTYSGGDKVTGNGHTDLFLTVIEGGNAAFARVENVHAIHITAGTEGSVNFQGGGWTGVGSVRLEDGVDGLDVFVKNLQAATDIGIAGVTGSISADYLLGSKHLLARLHNGDEGGAGGSAHVAVNGEVQIALAAGMSGSISNTSGIALGDITVHGAGSDGFSANFDVPGDLTLGDIAFDAGESSALELRVNGVDGDLAVGNADIEAGGDSDVKFSAQHVTGSAHLGDVTLAASDSSSVDFILASVGGDAVAGNVAIHAGDSATVTARYDSAASLDAGALTVVAGDASDVTVGVTRIGGPVSLGAVTLGALDDATVSLAIAHAQDVTAGDVHLSAGDGAHLVQAVFQSVDGNVSLGDVSATAGDTSVVSLQADAIGGEFDLGDFLASAGDDASVTASLSNITTVSGGKVGATAGANATASVSIHDVIEDITLGDVSATAGESGQATLTLVAGMDLDLGNLSVAAGSDGLASGSATSSRLLGTVRAGAVTAAGGDHAVATFSVSHIAANVGAMTLGNLAASAGDAASATVVAVNEAVGAPTTSNTGLAAGEMSVGNVSASVGDALDAANDVTAFAEVLYAGKATGATIGDFEAGDLHLGVGDSFLSGTQEGAAGGTLIVAAVGNESAGNATFGDATLQGGDFSRLAAIVGNSVQGVGGVVGNARFGDASIAGGEGSGVSYQALLAGSHAAEVGSMTFGDLSLQQKQDAHATLLLEQGAVSTNSASAIGDMTVGDVEAVQGDNSSLLFEVISESHFDGATTDTEGDFEVGNVSIAASATTSQDLAGGSSVSVLLLREHSHFGGAEGGDFTVGDVDLRAADRSSVALDIAVTGSCEEMGNVSLGELSLAVGGDLASAGGVVDIANGGAGDFGDVSIQGESLFLGEKSSGSFLVVLDHRGGAGHYGDISLGDQSISLAATAQGVIGFALPNHTAGATVGDFSIGHLRVEGEKGSTATFDIFSLVAHAIGDVNVGDFDATLTGTATARFSPNFTAPDVGGVSAGDVDASVGKGGFLSYSIDVDAQHGVGDLHAGDWDIALDDGGVANAWIALLASTGSLGSVELGDVDFALASGAVVDHAGLNVTAGHDIGGIAVGNVTVDADDGASAQLRFQAQAGHSAGDLTIGDIELSVADTGLTSGTAHVEVGAFVQMHVTNDGASHNDDVIVGDIALDVAGTAASDEVWIGLNSVHGDVTMGDLTVSGKGHFSFHASDTADANTSVLSVIAAGNVTIGNVDFSGYEGDASIDLSWTDSGAARITGGSGDDTVAGNAGDNVIAAGRGLDAIDISQGGKDTLVFGKGDSGHTTGHLDTIAGFTAGTVVSGALSGADADKLDFNLAAGSAGNYVERDADFGTLAEFVANADDALDTTVKYFVQDNGTDTYVAVNYGSGEADLVVVLAGVHDATTLQFQNFVV
ncbi:MAG TPA: hypothetical protein VHA82_20265 [Ramlibacter sp.]|uniref:beta strand repeat-containing protein n=1 Tax=Ramlibacter sp. TaxID=1917967 RepID=UPI002CDCD177|nr:hypothetical protein [Ramlibacter sp.]HVZ46153.1 hypothetical protein [Ramlibacter sp.]